MKFLRALESVMTRSSRPLWLNAILAAAVLFTMAAVTDGAGLPRAGVVLTWLAVLPLGLGTLVLADSVREEMKSA